jgi:hypothetical protein
MIIYDSLEQGTPEWLQVRAGKFTASTFSDLFTKETTQAYQNAINDVVYGKLTGEPVESYTNAIMQRGSELEPFARESYELETFTKVRQVGFIELNEWVGYSPDGLIGEDGLIEAKCPKHSTLIEYHLSQKIPTKYYWQMLGGMYVTGRLWCDYYVYHPKLKPLLIRVERNESDIKLLEEKLNEVIEIAKLRIEKLK